jgi:glucuronate isomerase
VITAYRPDPVVDPEFEGFSANLDALSALTGEDCRTWRGYLAAHRQRRAFFAQMGATSTDHGHPTAQTANLSPAEAEALFDTVARGAFTAEAELFRAQMLTEMAAMSCDDGLVMQIHPGSFRNHNAQLFERLGRDKGADIPTRTDYVHASSRCSTASATRAISRSSSSRWMKAPMPANWRRWPGTTPASNSARRGGSMIARKGCAASA